MQNLYTAVPVFPLDCSHGIHQHYCRCPKIRWTSLNSVNKETKKKSTYKQKFHLMPNIIFFSECSFSIFLNVLLPLRIKFSADNLEVWYSFCFHIDPVRSAGKTLPEPFVNTEEGEEHAYSGLLFHCFKIIFKTSLIFPRAAPRLVNTHLSETESLTSKNWWIYSQ